MFCTIDNNGKIEIFMFTYLLRNKSYILSSIK